jgi:hypothetical protein
MGSMLSGLAAWGGVAAVIWAAKQGRDAVADWRAQKQLERQMDTGERVLTAAYRAKDALEGIRGNFISAAELSRAEAKLVEDGFDLKAQPPERAKRLCTAQAIYHRSNATHEDWNALYSVMPFATAFFGKDEEECLRTIAHQHRIVLVAVESYVDDHDSSDRDFTRKLRADMFLGRGEDDPVAAKVNQAVANLESKIIPLLRNDFAASAVGRAKAMSKAEAVSAAVNAGP